MDPIFEGVRDAGEAVGLAVKRVKDVQGDYRITDQIIQMITDARLVVADLTHERPNVYFELGFARGLGKTVITIARDGTTVHFDVKDWTYISYVDSRLLERDIKKRFEFEISREGANERCSRRARPSTACRDRSAGLIRTPGCGIVSARSAEQPSGPTRG